MISKDVSLIVRAYNEAPALERLFVALDEQDFPKNKREIIVVDNGSADNTPVIASRFGVKYVFLAQEEFNYPKSSNLGIAQSTTPITIMTSAHALPLNRRWLSVPGEYLTDPLESNNIAGLFGGIVPQQDSPFVEHFFRWPKYLFQTLKGAHPVYHRKMGIMGATNCAFRRELWEKHPFDERYGAGSEDAAWASWALDQGYQIIFDPRFTVRHSHYQGALDLFRQNRYWKSLDSTPRPFDPSELAFRKDIKRSIDQ